MKVWGEAASADAEATTNYPKDNCWRFPAKQWIFSVDNAERTKGTWERILLERNECVGTHGERTSSSLTGLVHQTPSGVTEKQRLLGHVNTCRSLRKFLCRVTTPGALIGLLLPPDIWVHGGSCHHSTTPGLGEGLLLIPRMTEVKFHSGTSQYTLESDFFKKYFCIAEFDNNFKPILSFQCGP